MVFPAPDVAALRTRLVRMTACPERRALRPAHRRPLRRLNESTDAQLTTRGGLLGR
jgi:hypothetical protein